MSERTIGDGWSVGEFDPKVSPFAADPYPFYTRLLEESPVHFVQSVGMWWITRHDYAVMACTDGRFGREAPGGAPPPPAPPPQFARLADLPPHMLERDPPDHTRLRSLVSLAFTPRMVERLRPHIVEIASQLLDRVEARGHMDLMADFAFPLPAIVIAEMLGVPTGDRDRFKEWSNRIVRSVDATQPLEVRALGQEAMLALTDYFADLMAERRARPRQDMLSELIAPEEQGDKLSAGEVLSTCNLLLIAGHETTTNLIGSGMLTLLRHREQMELLRTRPELLTSAIEELLRFESPVQRMGRNIKQDVEVGGKLLKKGERVAVVFGAANRDPAVFAEPNRLDLARKPNPHLGFGRGIHYCLGAPLARLEAQIAFPALLRRFPHLDLADPGPVWGPNTLIRGLKSLPVRF